MVTRLATYRTTADVARSRQIAEQRKKSSAPLAQFKTEAQAYRAGYTEQQLMKSPFGRDLIERARHARQQRRATQRNQSYNYVVNVKLKQRPDGTYATQNVTVRSDRKLTKQQIRREASAFFDYEGKKTHYAGVDPYMVYDDKPETDEYFHVVGDYRGQVMRQEIHR